MKNRKIRKCFDRERHQLKFRDDNGDLLKKCLVQQDETDDTRIQNILKKYWKRNILIIEKSLFPYTLYSIS